MTLDEISILLLIFSANVLVLGITRYARSFLVVAFHLILAGVAGFFCYLSNTVPGATTGTVTLGLVADKPRRW